MKIKDPAVAIEKALVVGIGGLFALAATIAMSKDPNRVEPKTQCSGGVVFDVAKDGSLTPVLVDGKAKRC